MKYFKLCLSFCIFFSFFYGPLKAQNVGQVIVKSNVHDEKGKPVSGAVVSGNGGKTVTYTDKQGEFTIEVPANSVVLINARGFKMQTLRANAIPSRIGLAND